MDALPEISNACTSEFKALWQLYHVDFAGKQDEYEHGHDTLTASNSTLLNVTYLLDMLEHNTYMVRRWLHLQCIHCRLSRQKPCAVYHPSISASDDCSKSSMKIVRNPLALHRQSKQCFAKVWS